MSRFSEIVSIRSFRRQLASIDAIPHFALLGIISGLVTGIIILLFRKLIEWPLHHFLPDNAENFEGLSWYGVFLLPFAGGLILALGMSLLKAEQRRVGVVHVLERLARHQGHLPGRNLILQFIAGTLALITGQSGGREGPAIHLGAAASSLIGQRLHLPNNSIRVLVGCGAAAAISASFDTPMAGVIFSMEVIVMEYTVVGFIPVILAAVAAGLVIQFFYGSAPAFVVPPVSMGSLHNLPLVLVEALVIGVLAAVFVKAIKIIFNYAPTQTWLRLTIAGTVTGTFGLIAPQVLGIGYDTVNAALVGELSFMLLAIICILKLFATATSVAMGMPIGLIGPTMIIGGTAGGLIWLIASQFYVDLASPAFFVMLGMGAMMGSVLQAPLAALIAVMELTHNPNIILPAMLTIIIADITANQVFGLKSVFLTQMQLQGLEFRQNPVSMALNRASVASLMARNFLRVPAIIDTENAKDLVRQNLHWLLVDVDKKPNFIIRGEDLALYMQQHPEDSDVDLAEIPATRKEVTGILLQATLGEALDAINAKGIEALYINRISAPMTDSPVGIITLEQIQSYYQS